MSHKLEGDLSLEIEDEKVTVPLEEFYPAQGGENGNNSIYRHDDLDININVEINNGNAKVVSVKHQNEDVDDFEIDP